MIASLLSGCPDCPRSAPPPPPPPPVPMPKDPGDKIFGLKGSGQIKKLHFDELLASLIKIQRRKIFFGTMSLNMQFLFFDCFSVVK